MLNPWESMSDKQVQNYSNYPPLFALTDKQSVYRTHLLATQVNFKPKFDQDKR